MPVEEILIRRFDPFGQNQKRFVKTAKGSAAMTEPVEQDNMCIDWDVGIAMDDGVVVRADVFRPLVPGK